MALALDDKRLVQAHQAGEAGAFDRIVERYHDSLHRRAMQRLGDSHAAEDAVQETFLRAFRSLPRFNGEYRLGGWLRRILENVCADEGGRRSLETGAFQRWASMPVVDIDLRTPEGVVDELAARRHLDGAWRLLPPAHREALVLRFVHDLSFREVAAATGVTEENARARVSRARTALRGMLGAASGLAAFAFTALRRTERAAALTVERAGQSGAAQLATDTATAVGPAKAGVIAAVIGTVAASVAAPVALLLPTDADRSAPRTPSQIAVPVSAAAPESVPAAAPETPVVSAIDPAVLTGGQAQGRVVMSPPPAVPMIPTASAIDPAMAPPPVQMPAIPGGLAGGLVELTIPFGDLSFDQYGERIRIEGESLVLTGGDLVLTGDLEIRVRTEEGATGSAESGRIRGSFEFVDAAGVTHEVRLRGDLVGATIGEGATSYRFEGVLQVRGGGSVPFATDVTVPGSPVPVLSSSPHGGGVQAPAESSGAADETTTASGQGSQGDAQIPDSPAVGAGDLSGSTLGSDTEVASPESFPVGA